MIAVSTSMTRPACQRFGLPLLAGSFVVTVPVAAVADDRFVVVEDSRRDAEVDRVPAPSAWPWLRAAEERDPSDRARLLEPVRPQWQGTLLATGAGLAGAALWASTSLRMSGIDCNATALAEGIDGPACSGAGGLTSLGELGYVGAWRGASVGARMLGHRDALGSVAGDGPRRNATAYIASGTVMFALGLVGWAGAQASLDAASCEDPGRCNELARVRLGTLALSHTVLSAGGGLLAYGVAYRRAHRRLQRHALLGHLRVSAQLSSIYTGVSIGGSF